MLQTSLLLMKSLNKTETPIFLSVLCSLFPKAIVLTFISMKKIKQKIEKFIIDKYFKTLTVSVLLQMGTVAIQVEEHQ